LLTERDFSDEQRYLTDRMRLHSLRLHGWGVVCGLIVKPHQHCPEKRVVVTEGFAIDSGGREIRVLKDDELTLPKPAEAPAKSYEEKTNYDKKPSYETKTNYETKPSDETKTSYGDKPGYDKNVSYEGKASPPESQETQHGSAGKYSDKPDAKTDYKSPRGPDDDEDAPLPYNPCDETPEPTDLYICIRYVECETEFGPAPFDDCSCSDSSQKPNRICESYKLEYHEDKPEGWDKVPHEECESGDCGEYYRDARKHCHKIHCFPCLPLAVIHNFVPGQPVKADDIDNWGVRRQLTSTETLDKIVRCILHKLPTEELTRIEDTNWEHGRRMLCREFMEEFVNERGFKIEFSHKVHSAGIDTRSFQALVVFRPDNMAEPKRMEMAPAHVERADDETKWCKLRIDPHYARKHLDGRNFDLFLILKCDVITDQHGHAVDGNFIGRHLPTGDHIQGGTFESWIRVRPRARNN